MNYDGERKPKREDDDTKTTKVDAVFNCVFPYVDRSTDRREMSLVCKRWKYLESLTRKKVNIANCYATTPQRFAKRFPHIEALKLKGKPKQRFWVFDLLPENWGGYAKPWVDEIVLNLRGLKCVHFRRMIVTDGDLENLAKARGAMLQELRLEGCSHFTTDGLLHVARSCRNLKVLSIEGSKIVDQSGEWLHEIAMNNTVLEALNFYKTGLLTVDIRDLELISIICRSLKSVKINNWDIYDLSGFFRSAASLEEFYGGVYNRRPEVYSFVTLPATLHHLGLPNIGRVCPLGPPLKKLDLADALLNSTDIRNVIRKCPNLEVLETRNVIGDRGLEVLVAHCKKLKKLRIEHKADNQDEAAIITKTGLQRLAEGCSSLKYLAVCAYDVTNESLARLGTCLKLQDFRLFILVREGMQTDWPLDDGVRALLEGCTSLVKFALLLRPGALTDVGLGYIGKYSQNVKWMSLGHVGESDSGLIELSKGCVSLEKLEIRECCFSERALVQSVCQLRSLKFLWVQGYPASVDGNDLLTMLRPCWNIELIPAGPREHVINGRQISVLHPAQILAYPSLDGRRTDCPGTVIQLLPGPLPV